MARGARATQLLKSVRISAPESRVREYPHQMSGGMRQRIVGAIAISCSPRLLIADEPTTSLDLTIQAQYLNLLRDLQREHRLALIFITHNLGIVAKMCDQVAVMYAGRARGVGAGHADLRRPGPSLHAGAAGVDPAHGGRPRAPHRGRGPAARPRRAAERLRLPPALPAGRGPLPRGGAARDGHRTHPHRALLAQRARRVPAPRPPPSDDRATAAAGGPQAHQALPGASAGYCPRRSGWCARSTACRSPSRRARPWAWWASPAAARPPPPSWCCAWRSPPAAPCTSTGATWAA